MVDVDPIHRASERARALDDDRYALAVAKAQRRRTYGPAGVAVTLGLLVAVGLATAIPLALMSRGVITEASLEWIMPTSMLGTFVVGLVLALVWQNRTPAVARERSSMGQGTASPAQLEREIRRVRLARLGEARLMATQVRGGEGSLDLILGASLVLPTLASAVWFTIAIARGDEPYEPAVWLLWLGGAAGLALIIGLRLRRRYRKRRLVMALERAGRSFAGYRLVSHDHVVAWLNDVWAAPSEHADLYQGTCHGAVAGRLRGYPVLIDVEPDGYSDGDVEIAPRVLVHVAAWVGPAPPPGPAWQEHHAALAGLGLELVLAPEAGLLARARPDLLARVRRQPEALAELGAVVQRLVGLAEAWGAGPAPSARELGPPG
jgi:hypothetical protein